MKKPDNKSENHLLRQKAEKFLKKKLGNQRSQLSETDMIELIHELDMYQIELELMNEELALASEKAKEGEQENEERYRQIYQFSPDSIVIHDMDMNILDANNKAVEELGYSKKELLEKRIVELHPETELKHSAQVLDAMKNKSKLMVETKFVRKDGSVFLAEVTPCKYTFGKKPIIHVVIRNITERKRSENELLESREEYRSFFEDDITADLIATYDGKLLNCNPAFINLFEFSSKEEALATPVTKHYRNPEQRRKLLGLITQNKKLENYELGLITNSGREITVKANLSGTFDNEGNLQIIKGYMEDITKKRNIETALKESEDKFKQISQSANDGIILINNDGEIVFWNMASESIFGYKEEEIIGMDLHSLLTPEKYQSEANKGFKDFRETGAGNAIGQILQVEGKRKNGEIFPMELSLSSLKLKGKWNAVGIVRDISERKEWETQLITAKEKAEESDRLKSAFLANLSHEIRTPMNGILGFARLLNEPHVTFGDQKMFIEQVEKSSDRMLNTITNVVNISAIESGQMKISISTVNVNEQIEKIYTIYKSEVERKGLRLSINTALSLKEAIIETDSEKLHATLCNLVNNAIKFTHTGSIEFGYEKKEKHLVFFIKDTGVGIPDDKKEIIFERFRQGSESMTRGYEGAGLGLSIARAYVEILGGKIWAETKPGKGSTFYFTLPYIVEQEKEAVATDVSAGIEKGSHTEKLKIMIVEDDDSSELFLSTALEMYCKEMLTARTGIEAVEICRNNPDLDLILMDIRMPDMDGYEATKKIRQFNKEVIIIAQTAFGLSGDSKKAIDAGCNAHISKPVDIALLKAVIRKHCKK